MGAGRPVPHAVLKMDFAAIKAEYQKAQAYFDYHVAEMTRLIDTYNSLTIVSSAAFALYENCYAKLHYSETKNHELCSDERIARGSYERAEAERLRAEQCEVIARTTVNEAGSTLDYWKWVYSSQLAKQQPRTPGGEYYAAGAAAYSAPGQRTGYQSTGGAAYPAPGQGAAYQSNGGPAYSAPGHGGGYQPAPGPTYAAAGQEKPNEYYSARRGAGDPEKTPEKGSSRHHKSSRESRTKDKQRDERHSRPAEQARSERHSGRRSSYYERTPPRGNGKDPKRDSHGSKRTPGRESEREREPPRSERRARPEPQPQPHSGRRPGPKYEYVTESEADSSSEDGKWSPPLPPRHGPRSDYEPKPARGPPTEQPAPPEDLRPRTRPTPEDIQKWFATVDKQLRVSNLAKMETFPKPPAWRCGVPACAEELSQQRRKLDACTCNLKYLFEGHHDFKEDRRKWYVAESHPCPFETRPRDLDSERASLT